jgi:hypothetical protein
MSLSGNVPIRHGTDVPNSEQTSRRADTPKRHLYRVIPKSKGTWVRSFLHNPMAELDGTGTVVPKTSISFANLRIGKLPATHFARPRQPIRPFESRRDRTNSTGGSASSGQQTKRAVLRQDTSVLWRGSRCPTIDPNATRP